MIEYDYQARIRYADIDQMGIMYYSRYYEFFEAARTDMLRDMNFPYSDFEKSGFMMPILESHCEYKKGARFDQLINVKCLVKEIPKVKIKINYIVTNTESQSLLARGFTVHAFMKTNGKVCRAPENFVNLFK